VARMRESGRLDPGRLGEIQAELGQYPDDWLLRHDVGELLAPSGT